MNAHTHAYTDTAVWAHLFLWRSELIPAWSHRPCADYKLKISPSPPCLHLFFPSYVFFLSHFPPHLFFCFHLCVPLHFLISVSPAGHVHVLFSSPALFFHCTLSCTEQYQCLSLERCSLRPKWATCFPKVTCL